MSKYQDQITQYQPYDYYLVQQDNRIEETTTKLPADGVNFTNRNNFKPRELRTPALVAFSVLTLIIFVLLQISAAAFVGAPGVHSLVQRSVGSTSPSPSSSEYPTGAPGRGSYGRPGAATPTPTLPPVTAPRPGSYSSTFGGTGYNDTVNTALLSTASGWRDSFYFAGGYLPTLVAIVLGIWWKCIFARLKEMEPFYQITNSDRATTNVHLLLSYPETILSKVLYQSFVSKHWSSFLGAVNMALIILCTLFASETLFLASVGDTCGIIVDDTSDVEEGCHIVLALRPILAWTLGAILIIVFALTICVIIRLRRYRSGISTDPTSIAGIACLFSDLNGRSTVMLHDESKPYPMASLSYMNTYSNTQWTDATVRPVELDSGMGESSGRKHGNAAMLPASLAAFCIFMIGLLIIILYYRFVSKPGTGNALEDFMNSQSFGVRILMTALGLLIKFYWEWVERHLRCISPYVALASPEGATARESVLLSHPSHPVTALFHRETWKHLLLTLATLMAVLSEALIITLNGIPFSPAMVYLAFNLSVYISVGILVAMIITIAMILVRTMVKKDQHRLPVLPKNMAEVLDLLGDEYVRKVLSDMYNGNTTSHSHMRFTLRKEMGSRAWNIKIWTPNGPSLQC